MLLGCCHLEGLQRATVFRLLPSRQTCGMLGSISYLCYSSTDGVLSLPGLQRESARLSNHPIHEYSGTWISCSQPPLVSLQPSRRWLSPQLLPCKDLVRLFSLSLPCLSPWGQSHCSQLLPGSDVWCLSVLLRPSFSTLLAPLQKEKQVFTAP